MKTSTNTIQRLTMAVLALLLVFTVPYVLAGKNGGSGGGGDGSGGGGGGGTTQVYDTSFAVEFSYSCLSGGCHETNTQLVDQYSRSFMTHAMVKCNACHGTHTAAELGQAKPNLTGYTPGMGATGYIVGNDRCKVCHNNQHTGGKKASNDCKRCHTPHVFSR
ncbi:MAG: hypothetical protein OEY67_03840 [Gammaproteobacteria bacterium]|nr:hypothetical protein [Gammaproteobacteria bacterium]